MLLYPCILRRAGLTQETRHNTGGWRSAILEKKDGNDIFFLSLSLSLSSLNRLVSQSSRLVVSLLVVTLIRLPCPRAGVGAPNLIFVSEEKKKLFTAFSPESKGSIG
jgi:hypothetical protein